MSDFESVEMKIHVAAACAVILAATAGCSRSQAEDKVFDAKVHAYLLAHPEVLLEMQEAYTRKQIANESAGVQKKIATLHKQIFDDPRDPSVGPKTAKVTVVEFFDYRCPHCKEAAPEVLALMRAHPDVRFVFKEFPIFGATSQAAAGAALAANQQGKYLPVYSALMADRAVDAAAVSKILSENGLSTEKSKALAESDAVKTQLADVKQLAIDLGVEGTPGFVVNGHYVVGADMAQLTKLIDQETKR